jgi:hypothetical protein
VIPPGSNTEPAAERYIAEGLDPWSPTNAIAPEPGDHGSTWPSYSAHSVIPRGRLIVNGWTTSYANRGVVRMVVEAGRGLEAFRSGRLAPLAAGGTLAQVCFTYPPIR